MNFNHLPTEIQLYIFSYLKQSELCKFVSPVCKRWNEMAYDPMFWKSLDFDGDRHNTEFILRMLQTSSNTNDLTISYLDDWEWTTFLPKRDSLRKLRLDSCTIRSKDIATLVDKFPSINELTLDCTDDDDDDFFKKITEWKSLRIIIISFLFYHQIDNALSLISNKCTNLKEIVLETELDSLSESSFLNLIKQRGSNLRVLSVTADNLTDVAFKSLLDCKHLEKLELSYATRMNTTCLEILKKLASLRHLSVSYAAKISAMDLLHFPKSAEMCQIRKVKSFRCNFDTASFTLVTQD